MLVSVELDEVMALSDRILVLYRGRIQGELETATTTEEEVGILMAGGTLEDLQPRAPAPTASPTEVKP
jgi:simple sugar transport system ATP-binding protein